MRQFLSFIIKDEWGNQGKVKKRECDTDKTMSRLMEEQPMRASHQHPRCKGHVCGALTRLGEEAAVGVARVTVGCLFGLLGQVVTQCTGKNNTRIKCGWRDGEFNPAQSQAEKNMGCDGWNPQR